MPELRALPRLEWLCKGVLFKCTIVEIFGPYSCGKSFFAGDLALHIALGWDWHGYKVKQCPALYVSAEGGVSIVNRLLAFEQAHNIPLDNVPFAGVIDPTSLLDDAGVNQVLADAQMLGPELGLIIIDTAAAVTPGSAEDAESMSRLLAACQRVRSVTGATVAIVHHSGKDVGRGSRGSTVLPAGCDTMIEISRDSTAKVSSAEIVKQRDGQTGPLLNFNLNIISLFVDEDGDAITSCVVAPTTQKVPKRQLSPTQNRALQQLEKAMVDHGRPAPDDKNYPGANKVVPVQTWRQHLISAGIIDKNHTNPSQAFKRILNGLADKNAVRAWNELVWIVKKK